LLGGGRFLVKLLFLLWLLLDLKDLIEGEHTFAGLSHNTVLR
jgi:hypothetical protein